MRRADTALLAAKRMTSQIRVPLPRARHRDARAAGGRRQDDLAAALAAAVDAKDGDGYDHSRTVAKLVGLDRQLVGLSLDQVEHVRMAGLLHDVGYLDVNDEIFAKGGQPTDEEWDELASHAERGGTHPRAAAGSATSPSGSATTTSAWTATAIPTGSPARRTPSRPASCTWPMRTRR